MGRTERFLVKRAYVTIEVADVAESRSLTEALVAEFGGFLHASQAEKEGPTRLEVRIPSDKLDKFLARLATVGDVQEQRVEADDVTEQVVDLEARRKNLVAVRDRLRKHLAKATDVEGILAVEKELSRVQGEIEAMDARLKHLRRTAAMSSVSVTLKRPTVLGPIAFVVQGIGWGLSKLFIIRP